MLVLQRLQTVLCDTAEARDLHYRLRYKVFCEQTGFERADAFPDGRETDRYDEDAIPFIVGDRLTGRWIGAMRLIDGRKTRLPVEQICHGQVDGLDGGRERSVELSRLSVLKDGRSGLVCDPLLTAGPTVIHAPGAATASVGHERNEALVRLVWATIRWAQEREVDYVYGIVTAPLARMLRTLGIPATVVGTEVRFRGVRRPYRYDVHQAARDMPAALPQAAAIFSRQAPFVPYSELMEARRRVA
jgi:N-acyl amino acid synthase of PEP-CTERM/exosortase system